MWEGLYIWIDMYYLGAAIVSEIKGDKKINFLKKKKGFLVCCVELFCPSLNL